MFKAVQRGLQSGQTLCSNNYSEGQRLSTESDTDDTIGAELAEFTALPLNLYLYLIVFL